ncbi:hypothetical protein ABZY20_11155 [Streptomyces sp. NPDC006624]|uniref:hypothetical protein n=1 Tax=unclassified Streptomyces TaxID=2593676 RepID=UPI00339DE564
MTGKDTPATVPDVVLRADGEVDEETMEYARVKIDAVVGRPGLPPVSGEVRITRASAHHGDRPWSATATLRVGRRDVVVLAEETTGRELIDHLQDRLRRQTDKAADAAHGGPDGHGGRRAAAPPWRGGSASPRPAGDGGVTADPRPA